MFCVTGREGEDILDWLRSPPRLPDFFRRVNPLLRNTLLLTLATCILIAGVSFSWPPSPAAVTVFAPRREGGEEQRNNLLASFLQWLPLDYREVLSHVPLFRYEKIKGKSSRGGAGSFWEKAVGLLTWLIFEREYYSGSGTTIKAGEFFRPETGRTHTFKGGKWQRLTRLFFPPRQICLKGPGCIFIPMLPRPYSSP